MTKNQPGYFPQYHFPESYAMDDYWVDLTYLEKIVAFFKSHITLDINNISYMQIAGENYIQVVDSLGNEIIDSLGNNIVIVRYTGECDSVNSYISSFIESESIIVTSIDKSSDIHPTLVFDSYI